MNSKTKIQLNQSTIEQLCKKTFGNDVIIGNIIEYSDGSFNTSYGIELSSLNKDVVLKVAPPQKLPVLTYEQNMMRTEFQMSEQIRQKTSVPLPELIDYNSDHSIIDSDYIFMSRLTGVQLNELKDSIDEQQLNDIYRQLGQYVAELHSLKGDSFGYINNMGNDFNRSWKNTYFSMMQDLFDDAQRIDLELFMPEEEIKQLLENASSVLDTVTEPRFVHFDINDGNVFIIQKEEKYYIEAIIDFERAFWADPICEFISLAPGMNMKDNTAFVEAYNSASANPVIFDETYDIKLSLYRVYKYMTMYVESKYREVDIEAQYERQYSQFRLSEEFKKLSSL